MSLDATDPAFVAANIERAEMDVLLRNGWSVKAARQALGIPTPQDPRRAPPRVALPEVTPEWLRSMVCVGNKPDAVRRISGTPR